MFLQSFFNFLFHKVSTFCDRIQDFVMSPLRIQAEKSLVKKIAIGALAVLGGGAFAYVGKLRLYFFVGVR